MKYMCSVTEKQECPNTDNLCKYCEIATDTPEVKKEKEARRNRNKGKSLGMALFCGLMAWGFLGIWFAAGVFIGMGGISLLLRSAGKAWRGESV